MVSTNFFNRQIIFLTAMFVLLLFSNLIFPIVYDDDFFYSAAGSPFALQWAQYLGNWHGRLISHIPLRLILQWGTPFTDIAVSLLALLFFITAYMQINPRFLFSNDSKDFHLFVILTVLLYAFIPVSCTAYGMTTFFMSNIFALTLVFIFLIPYSSLLRGKNINPKILPFFAFIAGASHEQAVVILPLLTFLLIFLKWVQKREVPQWFYTGMACFFLGMLVILLSPSTFQKERLLGYGNAENWEFMGQYLNWINLGWKRYFYSLMNWMFFTKTGAAFVPNVWPYLIVFCILLTKLFYKNKALIFHSLFYFMGSWALIFVMMFSPLYYQANLIFGIVFMMISIVSLLANLAGVSFLKKTTIIFSVLLLFIYTIQAFAWNYYRKEYNNVAVLIKKPKLEKASQVEVPAFTQFSISTPLGNIYPVYLQRTPTFYLRMAEYYQSPPIIVQ